MTADRLLRAGAGLKPEHQRHILETRPDVGWFEVHAENYMGAGGPPHHFLERVRALYPLSVHGVGLSVGSADVGKIVNPTGIALVAVNSTPRLLALVSACAGDQTYCPLASSATVPLAVACAAPSSVILAVTVAPVSAAPELALTSTNGTFCPATFLRSVTVRLRRARSTASPMMR